MFGVLKNFGFETKLWKEQEIRHKLKTVSSDDLHHLLSLIFLETVIFNLWDRRSRAFQQTRWKWYVNSLFSSSFHNKNGKSFSLLYVKDATSALRKLNRWYVVCTRNRLKTHPILILEKTHCHNERPEGYDFITFQELTKKGVADEWKACLFFFINFNVPSFHILTRVIQEMTKFKAGKGTKKKHETHSVIN